LGYSPPHANKFEFALTQNSERELNKVKKGDASMERWLRPIKVRWILLDTVHSFKRGR
jgi:hypothetical protein